MTLVSSSPCTHQLYVIFILILRAVPLDPPILLLHLPVQAEFRRLGAAWEVDTLATLTLKIQQLREEVCLGETLHHGVEEAGVP